MVGESIMSINKAGSLLLLSLLAMQAVFASASNTHFEKGTILHVEEKYLDAVNEFSLAIKENPKDSESYYSRAISLINMERNKEALPDLNKCLSLDAKHWQAYSWRGYLTLVSSSSAKATQEGIEDLNQAVKYWQMDYRDIERDYIYGNRAKAYKKLGKMKESRADALMAEKLLLVKKAKVGRETRDMKLALSMANKACQAIPDDPNAYWMRSLIYINQEQFKEAIVDLDRAVKLAPYFPPLYYLRADCQTELGQFDKAIADYSKIVELNKRLVALRFVYETGRLRGKSEFSDLHVVNLADVRILRGNLYMMQKKYTQAVGDYTVAIKLDAKETEPYLSRGKAYTALKEWKEAEQDLNKAIKLMNGAWECYLALANMYEQKGDIRKAEEAFDSLVADEKSVGTGPRLMRGQFFARQNKTDKALADFNFCLSKDESDEDACRSRADLYLKLKRYEMARADYKKLLQIAGSDKALIEAARAGLAKLPH